MRLAGQPRPFQTGLVGLKLGQCGADARLEHHGVGLVASELGVVHGHLGMQGLVAVLRQGLGPVEGAGGCLVEELDALRLQGQGVAHGGPALLRGHVRLLGQDVQVAGGDLVGVRGIGLAQGVGQGTGQGGRAPGGEAVGKLGEPCRQFVFQAAFRPLPQPRFEFRPIPGPARAHLPFQARGERPAQGRIIGCLAWHDEEIARGEELGHGRPLALEGRGDGAGQFGNGHGIENRRVRQHDGGIGGRFDLGQGRRAARGLGPDEVRFLGQDHLRRNHGEVRHGKPVEARAGKLRRFRRGHVTDDDGRKPRGVGHAGVFRRVRQFGQIHGRIRELGHAAQALQERQRGIPGVAGVVLRRVKFVADNAGRAGGIAHDASLGMVMAVRPNAMAWDAS